MYEIMQAFGGLPTIFLRWNPDSFQNHGKTIKNFNQSKRFDILKNWIDIVLHKNQFNQGMLYYKQLFYDNYDEANVDFKVIKEEECI